MYAAFWFNKQNEFEIGIFHLFPLKHAISPVTPQNPQKIFEQIAHVDVSMI